MRLRAALLLCAALAAAPAGAEITGARYTAPTTRYTHGVLGDAVEYGALDLTLATGQTRRIILPEPRVFEDIAPRLADIDGDGAPEVIAVESDQARGARLSIYGEDGLIAATPHIGTRFRWLAPLGAADLDGDGVTEIAYIDRPHLAKTLRVWRFRDGRLHQVATLAGLTNHRIGEAFISGGLRHCGPRPEIIAASADWSRLMAVTLDGRGLAATDLGPYSRENETAALACRTP
ncbi:MAG: FG-GAP repeat domain-containing protein [Paracoccaceae bacterium]